MDGNLARGSSRMRARAIRRCRVSRGVGMLVLLVPAVMTLLLAGAGAGSAATLQVCPSGCPYTQIAPAVAAAKSGDTIKVGPGTYVGGITIDVSVRLAIVLEASYTKYRRGESRNPHHEFFGFVVDQLLSRARRFAQ